MNKNKEKSKAKERWRLLKTHLLKRRRTNSDDEDNASNVKVEQQFWTQLFDVTHVDNKWTRYEHENLMTPLFVRRVVQGGPTTPIVKRARKLAGFNNTGNVCIWASEIIMAYYFMKHENELEHLSWIELGAGQSALASMCMTARYNDAKITVTDGNQESIHWLQENVKRNNFTHRIIVKQLRWSHAIDNDIANKFDCVIAADCCFFDEYHDHLLNTIIQLLKEQGEAYLFQPNRHGTADKFANLCKYSNNFIKVDVFYDYDDDISRLRDEYATNSNFDIDIHYPTLIKLIK